jgi:hypothetical protein
VSACELVTWGGDPMPAGVAIEPATSTLRLTRSGARKLTDTIRGNLERAAAGLIRAWHGRANEALGYGEGPEGWQAYVAAEFGDLRLLNLPIGDRVGLERAMSGEGWSRREVARGVGVSPATVSNDLLGRPELRRVDEPEVLDAELVEDGAAARGNDGAAAPIVPAEPPAGMTKRARTVQLVAEQAERGLTALELAEVTGWRNGQASGTLSDLDRQRRVVRTVMFRRGFAAYVITGP